MTSTHWFSSGVESLTLVISGVYELLIVEHVPHEEQLQQVDVDVDDQHEVQKHQLEKL